MRVTSSPKNKALIIGLPIALIIILGLGYFVGVPLAQLRDQKALDAKHKLVDGKMTKVYESFKRDAFTKPEQEPISAKVDIKVAQDAVKDARAALDNNATALTKFRAMPLLDWNKQYRTATQLDKTEESYIAGAHTFLKEYEELLAYADKTADLGAKAEAIGKAIESIDQNATPDQMASQMDAKVAELQALVDQDRTLTVPAFIKADHDADLKTNDALVAEFKKMIIGLRKLDLAAINAADTNVTKLANESDAQDKAFVTKLQTNSPIQKQIDTLRAQNNDIERGYSSL